VCALQGIFARVHGNGLRKKGGRTVSRKGGGSRSYKRKSEARAGIGTGGGKVDAVPGKTRKKVI